MIEVPMDDGRRQMLSDLRKAAMLESLVHSHEAKVVMLKPTSSGGAAVIWGCQGHDLMWTSETEVVMTN